MRTYEISPELQGAIDGAAAVAAELARVNDVIGAAEAENQTLEANISKSLAELGEIEASEVLDGVTAGYSAVRKKLVQLRAEQEPVASKIKALRTRACRVESEVLQAHLELETARREFVATLIPIFQAELDAAVAAFQDVLARRHALAFFGVSSRLQTNLETLAEYRWRESSTALEIETALSPARSAALQIERLAERIRRESANRAPAAPVNLPSVTKAPPTDERPGGSFPASAAVPDWLCRRCLLGGPHATAADCERAKAEQPTVVTAGAAAA